MMTEDAESPLVAATTARETAAAAVDSRTEAHSTGFTRGTVTVSASRGIGPHAEALHL